MALIENFNATLKEVPLMAKELKGKILVQQWSKARTAMAMELVSQLERKKIFVESLGDSIHFKPLYLIVQPEDVGVRRVIFDLKGSENAKKYIEKLLEEINGISPKIKFNIDSFYAESRYIKIFISFDIY